VSDKYCPDFNHQINLFDWDSMTGFVCQNVIKEEEKKLTPLNNNHTNESKKAAEKMETM